MTAPSLVERERAFTRVLMRAEPPSEDLARLGGPKDRWLLYRDMVRTRMKGMIATALARTVAALGPERYAADYRAWLDEAPPKTRFIREIVPAFHAFAAPRWAADATLPAWLPDLARFEAIRWEIAYLDVPIPDAGDFAFEKIPVMNPTVRLEKLAYRVHAEPEDGAGYEEGPQDVLFYRRLDDDKTGYRLPDPLTAAFVTGFLKGEAPVTDIVRDACQTHGTPLDAPLLERLSGTLADYLGRTIVLGSR